MDPLRETAARWLAEGRPACVVGVQQARGSVPRGPGTRMLVDTEAVVGSIGGGHLEWTAIAIARQRLAQGRHDRALQAFALGPALGQCCGGALTLRFEPLDAEALADWPLPAPRFTLQLHGAGHVGRALVRLLTDLPCSVHWVDERADSWPATPLPPHVQTCCAEPAEAEVALAPPQAFFLVMTHRHDLDLRITEAVLRRGDFAFLGVIGSATKRARFLHRLAERGLPPDTLDRLTCPVGLPGITGKEPEVIALAVAAQLLQQAPAR